VGVCSGVGVEARGVEGWSSSRLDSILICVIPIQSILFFLTVQFIHLFHHGVELVDGHGGVELVDGHVGLRELRCPLRNLLGAVFLHHTESMGGCSSWCGCVFGCGGGGQRCGGVELTL
jgi:hypothetical protein